MSDNHLGGTRISPDNDGRPNLHVPAGECRYKQPGECLGVKGSQVQILSSRQRDGPLALAETSGQRAVVMLGLVAAWTSRVGLWTICGHREVLREQRGRAFETDSRPMQVPLHRCVVVSVPCPAILRRW